MVINLLLTLISVANLSKPSLAAKIGISERTIDRHVEDPEMGFQEGTLRLIKTVVIEEIRKSDRLSISEQEYLLEGVRKHAADWPEVDQRKIMLAEAKLTYERLKVRKARNKRGDADHV